MSKSISNDAIWEKLSEIDEKLSNIQNKPLSRDVLPIDELKRIIEENANRLIGKTDANTKELKTLNSDFSSVKETITNIPIPDKLNLAEIKNLFDKKDIFRFGFVRFRKTSFTIAILGVLVFTLTMFCMKLYSDSLIYQNNSCRQVRAARHLQIENDSLKVKIELLSVSKTKMRKR